MSKEKLVAYEKEFDDLVNQFPLMRMPVRAPLIALHLTIDSLFNGSRTEATHAPRPEAACAAAARLSYIVPLLLESPCEPIGENARDAFEAAREADPDGIQRRALLSYGHFCEVMPEVHRDYYTVAGDVVASDAPRFAPIQRGCDRLPTRRGRGNGTVAELIED